MVNAFDDTDTLPLPPPLDSGSQNGRHGSETDDMQRDRFRLGRELARDFEDMATFTGPLPPPLGDYTDTLGTFDLTRDVKGASKRKIPLGVPKHYCEDYNPADSMLHHSPPTLDAEGIQAQFADFSMAADHRPEDSESYEVGRGHRDTRIDSLLNNTTDFFSMNPVTVVPSRGRRGGPTDQSGMGTSKSNTRSRKHHVPAYASPLQKSQVPSLEFSLSSTPRRGESQKESSARRRVEQPSKIMDVVSNSGSSASASKPRESSRNRDSEEDALSEINIRQKRSRIPAQKNLRKSSLPAIQRNRVADDEKLNSATKTRRTKATPPIPRAFKSTSDFLKELGVDGNTNTFNLQNKLGELKSTSTRPSQGTSSSRARTVEASFAIPKLPDMTDLFSANDVTRFSTKQGAATTSHVPIESIPIPHDSRALLAAMKLLEQKVDRLENARVSNQQTCKRLEDELRQAENQHHVKQRHYRQKVADNTFNLSEDGGALERAQQKANIEWKMEKLKMETHIESLRKNIDQVSDQLDEARQCLHVFQEDHDAAVSSVAAAIAAQEDLKIANQKLERQLAQSERNRQQVEDAALKQRQDYEAMESRLRKRAREAREAAAVAEEAMLDAARRELEAKQAASKLQSSDHGDHTKALERELHTKHDQPRQRPSPTDFDERVRDELLRIRPDLFHHHSPPHIPYGQAKHEGSKYTPPETTSRRASKNQIKGGAPEGPSDPPKDRLNRADDHLSGSDETAKLTLSPDEVRKLRKDIHAERYGRKSAQRLKSQAERCSPHTATRESALRRDGRRIVKVVYLLDDNTEVLELANELGQPKESASSNPGTEVGRDERPTSPQKDPTQPVAPSVRFAESADSAEESSTHGDAGTTPNHDAEHEDHDPDHCTVCLRYSRLRRQQQVHDEENPIADLDASGIMPAPELDPRSRRVISSNSSVDGDCTARPSADPELQLERVVKQLQDEFRHLKLVYQDKSDTFTKLDPSVGWRRRKALTNELNELVAEMGAKADQIYALYDVKEEIVGARARKPTGAESEGTEDLLHILGNRC
ncbi:hypothetical protein EX30DRAFT_363396 [Ascodesmis nigricans]|uniref:Cep57 centrosome microtubule-binding domain-containing protein n=1 Tax=Ascodesmis nigricans TaxID=341454 RepID=A0A4S2MYG8_9PEZI|nr:hypothetical protein EX30DRAFT_363396 [Ascodesmis nigricans]